MMEGALYGIEATVSAFVSLASFVLLVLAISGVFFGYMAEEEKSGRRLYWAEWPLPDTREATPENVVSLRAAA